MDLIFRLKRYFKIVWLPVVLTLLLVLQTELYGRWLNVIPHIYLVRRTAASIGLGALLFGPAVLFKNRSRHIYSFIFSFGVAFILVAQFLYYKYSGGFLQASAIQYIGQVPAIKGTIDTLLTPRLLLFIAGPLLVLVSFFVTKAWHGSVSASASAAAGSGALALPEQTYISSKGYPLAIHTSADLRPSLTLREKGGALVIILLIVVAGYGALLGLEKHDWGDTSRLYSRIYDLATLVGKEGIVNYSAEDIIKYAFAPRKISPQDQARAQDWYKKYTASIAPQTSAESAQAEALSADAASSLVPVAQAKVLAANTAAPKDFGLAQGRNLFVLQIESLENWVINYKIDGQEITPNLNALAKQGMYFPNYYAQIQQGNTADAELSTMTSLYPLPESVAFLSHADNTFVALPKELAADGYSTYAMHGDVPTFWNRSNIYPHIGYQNIVSRDNFTIPRPIGFDDLGDGDFFGQSVGKITNFKQPFSATLITLSSHTPFVIPDDLQTVKIPEQYALDTDQRNYIESVHYMDASLGQFLAQLKAQGIYDKSLFVLYGDHQNFLSAPGDAPLTKIATAFPDFESNHVPLLLWAPGSPLPAVVNQIPGSHIDLYPTLANLLGVAPPQLAMGQDLLNTSTPVVVQRKVITGTIGTILTDKIAFDGAADGEFDHSKCISMPDLKQIALGQCQSLYDQQLNNVHVSDTIIRGNLVEKLEQGK